MIRRLVLLAVAALTAVTVPAAAAPANAVSPPTIIKITTGHHAEYYWVTFTLRTARCQRNDPGRTCTS